MLTCVLVPAAEEGVVHKREREPSWTFEDVLDKTVAGEAMTPNKRACMATPDKQ